jgi:hypothetical protein
LSSFTDIFLFLSVTSKGPDGVWMQKTSTSGCNLAGLALLESWVLSSAVWWPVDTESSGARREKQDSSWYDGNEFSLGQLR